MVIQAGCTRISIMVFDREAEFVSGGLAKVLRTADLRHELLDVTLSLCLLQHTSKLNAI